MEYIFRADLFDVEFTEKVLEAALPYLNKLEKEHCYRLVISFNVDLLNDPRMDLVDVPLENFRQNESRKDKIYNLLRFQINRIDEAFSGTGLELINASIQGEQLNDLDSIKLQLEKKDNTTLKSKKKNIKPLKVTFIAPNLPYVQEIASDLANKLLAKIYNHLMVGIRDKKIMSGILGIKSTEDDNKLYKAFVKQYQGFWMATEDQHKALLNKLSNRIEIVLNKLENDTPED
ncbi:hypothetical protein [Paenibacillus sp. NPDC057934]|uniref:hypothetical protein n=1 Tax=Paenibacillus sp. NPDC057934 TaxID=3346282 RepID=UPI0036DB518E